MMEPGTLNYIDAMTSFYDTALPAFYREFTESDKVTTALLDYRTWFTDLDPEKNLVEHNISETNLSLFGNMIIRNLAEHQKYL